MGLSCTRHFNTNAKGLSLEEKISPQILKVEKLKIDLLGKRTIETRFCYATPSCKNIYVTFDFGGVSTPQTKQCKAEQMVGKSALDKTVTLYKDELSKNYGNDMVHMQVFYEESTKNVCSVLYWDSELLKEL